MGMGWDRSPILFPEGLQDMQRTVCLQVQLGEEPETPLLA